MLKAIHSSINRFTSKSVISEAEINRAKTVLWGGTILDTRSLKDATNIEVLAYPIDTSQRPLLESKPQGHFIIQHQGYLEPASYAQGRVLTVVSKVSGSLEVAMWAKAPIPIRL